MQQNLGGSAQTGVQATGHLTFQEIARQPELWPVVGKEVCADAARLQVDKKLRNK